MLYTVLTCKQHQYFDKKETGLEVKPGAGKEKYLVTLQPFIPTLEKATFFNGEMFIQQQCDSTVEEQRTHWDKARRREFA